jgi:hypothetical protein
MAFSVHVHLKANIAQDAAWKLAEQIAPNALYYRVGDLIEGPNGQCYRITRIERVASDRATIPPGT